MKKLLLCLGLPMLFSFSIAQVGINTESPRTTLDVNGSIQLRDELRVNNDPGTAGQIYFSQGPDGTTTNDWKSVNVPFLEDGQFQLVNTFAKRDQVGLDFSAVTSSSVTVLNETFETTSTTYAGWTQFREAGSSDWIVTTGGAGSGTPTAAQGGSRNMRFPSAINSGQNTPITKLISPVLNIAPAVSAEVSFWYAQSQATGSGTRQNQLKVYYRVSATAPWNEIAYYQTAVSAWTQVTLQLPNPSATYQIAFEGINNRGNPNVLDNVIVSYTANTGYNPALSALGESITAKNWTRIAGLDLPVTIRNGQNKLSLTLQTGVESRLTSGSGTSNQTAGFIRYACGLFRRQASANANTAVLVALRANQIDNYTRKTNDAKSQSLFTLNYVVENVPAGDYVFSTACRRLTMSPSSLAGSAILSIGNAAPNTGIGNTSDFMMNSVVKMDVMELVLYSN